MSEMAEPYVILADPHGDVPLLEAVCRVYRDRARFVVAGDVTDGPDVRGVMDRMLAEEVILVEGNHERYVLGAMLEHEDEEGGAERRRDIVDMWRSTHQGTLESYSIYGGPTPASALQLRDKMEDLGHLALLRDAPLYLEGDDFAVVHADVSSEPWEVQKAQLDQEKVRNLSGHYWGWSDEYLMPVQLGEQQGGVDPSNLSRSGLTKRLLSGHFHISSRNLADRSYNNGQHLLLAGGHQHDFAAVYESWTGQMRIIEVDS